MRLVFASIRAAFRNVPPSELLGDIVAALAILALFALTPFAVLLS